MKQSDIFKTLINILRSETVRTDMEFKPEKAHAVISDALSRTELKLLGMGIYSVVVEHEAHPGRVFKVSTSRWDGYREYAKYCMKHVGEPLIPIVYSAKEQGNFAWYELEKYYPLTSLTRTKKPDCPCNRIKDIVNVVQAASYSLCDIDYQLNNNMHTYGMRKPKREQYLKEMREYVRISRRIYDTFKSTHRLDTHSGNIMITVDNKVIITDPLANDLRREIPMTEKDPEFEVMV